MSGDVYSPMKAENTQLQETEWTKTDRLTDKNSTRETQSYVYIILVTKQKNMLSSFYHKWSNTRHMYVCLYVCMQTKVRTDLDNIG